MSPEHVVEGFLYMDLVSMSFTFETSRLPMRHGLINADAAHGIFG